MGGPFFILYNRDLFECESKLSLEFANANSFARARTNGADSASDWLLGEARRGARLRIVEPGPLSFLDFRFAWEYRFVDMVGIRISGAGQIFAMNEVKGRRRMPVAGTSLFA